LVKEGVTTGVTGVLLARGAIERFPVVSFLSQASADYMDPMASVSVLECLKDYLNLKLDTSDLEKDAHEVEAKMKDLLLKAKQTSEHYRKTTKEASMHEELDGMYR
jgi:predicted ATP-grasp superfamily ATP-dependent carboligase